MDEDKPVKLDVNTHLYILVEQVIEHNIDDIVIKQKQKVWLKAPCDINLGSLMKPNNKVLGYKYIKEEPVWKTY